MILNRDEATIACDAYAAAIAIEFPHFMVTIRVTQILGDVVQFCIANVPTVGDAPYGIIHNASFLAKGLIQTDRKGGAYMENPILSGDVKFRKISGVNEAEVLKKFHMWLLKNKDAINAIIPKLHRL
jgi:hypothetical protein